MFVCVCIPPCRYGFEVAFVTYKWPNWLHQQTEKQRTIWGYKILFLDVLFPLNLTKVNALPSLCGAVPFPAPLICLYSVERGCVSVLSGCACCVRVCACVWLCCPVCAYLASCPLLPWL